MVSEKPGLATLSLCMIFSVCLRKNTQWLDSGESFPSHDQFALLHSLQVRFAKEKSKFYCAKERKGIVFFSCICIGSEKERNLLTLVLNTHNGYTR